MLTCDSTLHSNYWDISHKIDVLVERLGYASSLRSRTVASGGMIGL